MLLIYGAIALAGLILLVGGALFGHDHDGDHGFDHGFDHGGDHGADHGGEAVVSIFSMRVIGTFIMGFGGGGTIGAFYGLSTIGCSLAGLAVGVLMGALMYVVLRVMYSQQSNSLISSTNLVGENGVVTIPIGRNFPGEVQVTTGSRSSTWLAVSAPGETISKGQTVIVLEAHGSQLLVKRAEQKLQEN
jgi:membrane-bound ClpP family serine protease